MAPVSQELEPPANPGRFRFSNGQEWTNPVTAAVVDVPSGWTVSAQKNAEGQPVYVFSRPSEELQVVFGYEEITNNMDFPSYFNAFVQAVSADMRLEAPGYKDAIGLREAWSVNGSMVTDASSKISITFLPLKHSIWRTVGVRFRGANPETKAYRVLREKLLLSTLRSN